MGETESKLIRIYIYFRGKWMGASQSRWVWANVNGYEGGHSGSEWVGVN